MRTHASRIGHPRGLPPGHALSARALTHAVEFGNSDVVDLLANAGAVVHAITEAAGVGILDGYDLLAISLSSLARAARAAAVCERVDVLDQLIARGVPVDADPDTGDPDGSRALLHEAATGANADPWSGSWPSEQTPTDKTPHTIPHRLDGAVTASPRSPVGEHLTAGHLHVQRILEPITKSE